VLGRIRILAENGLTPMMVLHDYVLKHIMPFQERTRLTWLYNGVNDVTQLKRGDGSALTEEVLVLLNEKLSLDPSSHDFITPSVSYQPLCKDQPARLTLPVAMPSMDNVGITPMQGGAAPSPVPSKVKGKVVRVVRSDDEVSSDDDVPL
jgi:hypothetical protein